MHGWVLIDVAAAAKDGDHLIGAEQRFSARNGQAVSRRQSTTRKQNRISRKKATKVTAQPDRKPITCNGAFRCELVAAGNYFQAYFSGAHAEHHGGTTLAGELQRAHSARNATVPETAPHALTPVKGAGSNRPPV
jgi:hypothetical protein